jgi:hypothetical protein
VWQLSSFIFRCDRILHYLGLIYTRKGRSDFLLANHLTGGGASGIGHRAWGDYYLLVIGYWLLEQTNN